MDFGLQVSGTNTGQRDRGLRWAGRQPGCRSVRLAEPDWLRPLLLGEPGRPERGRLPWDNGPLSCRVAAGPQTIGWGRAFPCCPRPETDAREPLWVPRR